MNGKYIVEVTTPLDKIDSAILNDNYDNEEIFERLERVCQNELAKMVQEVIKKTRLIYD